MERLTHQEENIMLNIWQLRECVVKDILQRLEEPKPPYTTVASIVRNLEQKGYLHTRKLGNVCVYTPRIKEKAYKKEFLSNVVENYFDNSYSDMVTFFVKEEKLSPEDLLEIVKLIEKGKNK